MRRLLIIPLLAFAMLMTAVPALADRPIDVGGDWTYEVTSFEVVKVVGQNTFIEGADIGTWTGTFEGTTEETFIGVEHRNHMFYKGEMVFTGTVLGREGSMTIKTNGTLDWDTFLWEGRWVIQHATGDLAGLHGQGTFEGPPFDLDYEGQIHFSH